MIDKHGAPTGGGCCTWYDETKLLTAVEARLKQKITVVPTPDALQQHVGKSVGMYGQEKGSANLAKLSEHVEQLKPAVEVRANVVRVAYVSVAQMLTKLEQDAQMSFYDLKTKFSSGESMSACITSTESLFGLGAAAER